MTHFLADCPWALLIVSAKAIFKGNRSYVSSNGKLFLQNDMVSMEGSKPCFCHHPLHQACAGSSCTVQSL